MQTKKMRGIRALIQKTAPGKLARSGKFACYRARTSNNRPTGPKLRGITKLLTKKLYSSTTPPSDGSWRGGTWQGEGGGLRRGKAVRTFLVNVTCTAAASIETDVEVLDHHHDDEDEEDEAPHHAPNATIIYSPNGSAVVLVDPPF